MYNVCDFCPELPRTFNYKKLHAMLTLNYKQICSSQVWYESTLTYKWLGNKWKCKTWTLCTHVKFPNQIKCDLINIL